MKNHFLFTLLFLTSFTTFGQSTITLKGKIIEKNHYYLLNQQRYI
jgi:hypothetical protein